MFIQRKFKYGGKIRIIFLNKVSNNDKQKKIIRGSFTRTKWKELWGSKIILMCIL